MKLKIVVMGKTPSGFVRAGCAVYLDRLKHYARIEWIEIPDKGGIQDQRMARAHQSRLIAAQLKPDDLLVLLDERGVEMGSRDLAAFLSKKTIEGVRSMCLVVGGAYGFSEELYQKCSFRLSLSRLTFPHDLVRVLLLEQLYRACTINRGESYHHD